MRRVLIREQTDGCEGGGRVVGAGWGGRGCEGEGGVRSSVIWGSEKGGGDYVKSLRGVGVRGNKCNKHNV